MREVWYKGKKLKVDWTPTLAEDLTSHYGIDVEEELSKIMQVELSKAIIKELRRLDKVPSVTDRVKPLSVSLDRKRTK